MKIYLDTLGCRLNQSEIETMARQFRAAGHEIVASADMADMAVVNTCAVTNDAASVSRSKIRQIARAGVHEIVATTGCWSTLQPQKANEMQIVLCVVANDRKDHLVADVLNLPSETFDLKPISRQPLPGLHRRTRAFIKVQDGCDNQCTFCITTVARGEGRSRRIAEVILDIQSARAGGTKEIVLTGVHLGSWGYDFDSHLSELIQAILRETDVPRLRLSSLEPWDLSVNFFSLWEDARLVPHLHLPLQSGCESTLKRMARKTTPDSFRDLVRAARAVMPAVAITTDIIAGFPGETEDEFTQTLEFVREINFADPLAHEEGEQEPGLLAGQVPLNEDAATPLGAELSREVEPQAWSVPGDANHPPTFLRREAGIIGGTMTERKDGVRKVIQCPCGYVIEADGDDALVARARDHARKEHGMELTSDQALAMARPA